MEYKRCILRISSPEIWIALCYEAEKKGLSLEALIIEVLDEHTLARSKAITHAEIDE